MSNMTNWLDASSTSNRYKQMYIKGFLDISGGNLILRNNNLYVNNGDASFNGRLFVSGDANLKNRLSVSQDVIISGNLYANYPSNSIPITAIAGGIPGSTGVFTEDVSINSNLYVSGKSIFNGDVSMNSTLKINGNATVNNLNVTGTVSGITPAMISLGNVNNTSDLDKPISTAVQNALNTYVSSISPAFTGIPTAPKATVGTNSTQLATTSYVITGISGLIGSAPTNLRTLQTIASAINNDASFAITINNKFAPVSAPIFIGNITTPKLFVTNDASLNNRLFVSSDTSMNGNLRVGKNISEGGVSLVDKYATIKSPTFTGDVNISNRLLVSSDTSLNGNLYISKKTTLNGDVSMNNNLDLSGSIIAHNNINVYGIINQYTTTLEQGYIVNYSNVTASGDLNVNGIILGKSTNGENTIVGINSGSSLTSGVNNTIFGYGSGSNITTGSNNILLGNAANSSNPTVSNEITLGNSAIATLRCQASSITSLSDIRDKNNIETIPAGLEFINKLNPVKFTWNTRDGVKMGIDDFGFIAQELQSVENEMGLKVPNLIYEKNPEKLEASYGALIPIMVKAIKELTELAAKQQTEIELLKLNIAA